MGMMALALLAAFAPGDEVLQPSTAWGVDYAEYSCTLSRSFGSGEGLVLLELTPQTGGQRLRVALTSKDRGRFPSRGPAALRAGEGASAAPTTDRYYSVDDPAKGRVAMMRTDRGVLTSLATARTLTVQLGDRQVALAVPQLGAALKALANCERDLAGGWGFDLSAIATAPAPTGAPQRWITNVDYPVEALRESISGETDLLIIVDAAGKPQRCAVTDGSGSKMLDQTACVLILKRGTFKPATGRDGQPIAAPWATTFHWELPGQR
jgi:TonB family protein